MNKLAQLLMNIQKDVWGKLPVAEQDLLTSSSLEVTLICHGLTLKQRRMLFEVFYTYYSLVERVADVQNPSK